MQVSDLRAFLPADPGRSRLVKALTTAVAVGVGLGAMWGLSPLLDGGRQMLVVAGFLALQAMLMVRDRTMNERRVTTALLIVPGIVAGVLNAAVHGSAYGQDVVFVAIATGAVWIRRYGTRASAVGMIAFFGYFFAQLLGVDMHTLPAFCTAVVCGLGGTALVRTVVIREMPGRRLHRMRRDLATAALLMIDTAWSAPRSAQDSGGWRRRTDRFAACVTAIQEWQAQYTTDRYVQASEEDLAQYLFGLQTGIEELCEELWAIPDGTPAPPELGATVGRIRSVLRRRAGDDADVPVSLQRIGGAPRSGTAVAGGSGALPAARQAETAVRTLAAVTERRHPARQARGSGPRAGGGGPSGAENGARDRRGPWRQIGRWDAGARATVQTLAATTVATVVGHLISDDRWYWAVLTAFMIFYNTASRGEILVRARHRITGTAVGVVAALALVALVGHHRPVEYVALVVCVFAVVYFGPLSYTVLTFFITLLLAWMYELMGIFDLRILEWRVEETLAGAVIGIGAAFLITPTHTTPIVVERMSAVLDRLEDVTDQVLDGAGAGLSAQVRGFDDARAAATAAAGTLVGGLSPRRIRTGRRLQRDLRELTWSVHSVARTAADPVVEGRPGDDQEPEQARWWAGQVHASADRYLQALTAETRRVGRGGPGPAGDEVTGAGGIDQTVKALRGLERCLQ